MEGRDDAEEGPVARPTCDRPRAGTYSTVFLTDGERSRLALVLSHVRAGVYSVVPVRWDDIEYRLWDWRDAWTVEIYDDDGGVRDAPTTVEPCDDDEPGGDRRRWRNAPLPVCCVCLERPADCALPCRCTAPRVCMRCVSSTDRCPQCRHRRSTSKRDPVCFLDRSRPAATVLIKTGTGSAFPVAIESFDTIRTLKEAIQNKQGIPPDLQHLYFIGRRLEDERTLADYNIRRESTIHLLTRLRGD
jgi:ubiquitin